MPQQSCAGRLQPLTAELAASHLRQVRLVATDMDGTLTVGEEFGPALLTGLASLRQANLSVIVTTGRSAGWVSGLLHYLPVSAAIAENGGVYFTKQRPQPVYLQNIAQDHRPRLRRQFERLQQRYTELVESSDNRFRLTDWTFDVAGLQRSDLQWLGDCCRDHGWGFTYSSIQCHIKLPAQDKAAGLAAVMAQDFQQLRREQVVTVGDSPNDESLFNPAQFPCSVGVANVRHYLEQMAHHPALVTTVSEGNGFCELVQHLLAVAVA